MRAVDAKIRFPGLQGLLLTRLLERLAAPCDGGRTVVVAPAGSSKTTLLAQFASSAGVPVAWSRLASLSPLPLHQPVRRVQLRHNGGRPAPARGEIR